MTQHVDIEADTRFPEIWRVPEAGVESGRLPGYVGAVRIKDASEIHAGGTMSIDAGSPLMTADSLFRIASVTKPMGGALALSLVQDGVIALDDPVAKWLPEAANPRVLTAPDAPLDSTTDAKRPITIRHFLNLTAGWGCVMNQGPLQTAMFERDVFPSAQTPQMSGDEFVSRVTSLPLAFQPGEGWLYDTCLDLLGILLMRATGQSLTALFAERITAPLGMASTGFWSPAVDRFTTAYRPGDSGLEVTDPADGLFSRPAAFEELGSGLVSTAADVLRFFMAMADGGGPVLTSDSLRLMTTDALTETQRQQGVPILGEGESWGLGTSVDIAPTRPWMAKGRWGWTGGSGTTAYVDPSRDTVCVLLTQREMAGPQDGFDDFWSAVAAS